MSASDNTTFFSIVISTRNRPELFETALQSVLDQAFPDREIIVVIDGSTETNLEKYAELKKRYTEVVFLELEHLPNGHGQSYTMNYGTHNSSGKYICFLDDDDQWIDNRYLERLFASITASKQPVDVHYSNQNAIFADGTVQHVNVWIQDLIPKVNPRNRNHEDSYFVDTDFLLTSKGFAHLNCTVLNRDFFYALGGMDESIRYENDRDIYIRSVDRAKVILYSTRFMALHNIPDVRKKDNMSTIKSEIDKKLYQLHVFDKGISLSKHASVVRSCRKGKAYSLKHTASILAESKRYASAAHYAMEALLIGFNFRWLAYTLHLIIQARLGRGNETGDNSQ